MNIVETICDSRPDDASISRFEKILGASLPVAYRMFLITHNGGRPKPSKFEFAASSGEREEDSVHYFFGLHDGRVGSLEKKLAMYSGRVPNGFLPIATDAFGNLILMATTSGSHGKIYFWDHELEAKPENTTCVAASFDDFVDSLSDPNHDT